MRDFVRWYILDEDHNAVPSSATEWSDWTANDWNRKRVKEDTLPDGRWISTVFMGLDHRWDDGPPILFETMVFQSQEDLDEQYRQRCSTWSQALKQHDDAVDWAIAHPDGEKE